MGDSVKKTAIPAWQHHSSTEPKCASETPKTTSTLERARKFLQDNQVRNAAPERKTDFLRSKGFTEMDIDKLIEEDGEAAPRTKIRNEEKSANRDQIFVQKATSQSDLSARTGSQPGQQKEDRAPIITYPEFLTKPQRPPSLVNFNGLLNTFYGFGGLSALIYGMSKYVVEPMVQSLSHARIEFHEHVNRDAVKLVEKLKGVVSEIPPSISSVATGKKPAVSKDDNDDDDDDDDDDDSSYDDPTEMFHRNVGVQTESLPSTSSESGPEQLQANLPMREKQARQLSQLASSLRQLDGDLGLDSADFRDTKQFLSDFRAELFQLSHLSSSTHGSGYSTYYGSNSRNEPDDEIKKVKTNIRLLKGLLLSTRRFPTGSNFSTRVVSG